MKANFKSLPTRAFTLRYSQSQERLEIPTSLSKSFHQPHDHEAFRITHRAENSQMPASPSSFCVRILTVFTALLAFTIALESLTCDTNTHNDPQVTWQTTKCAFCGPNISKASDTLWMNYNGTLLNGTLFDSSYTVGKPWPAGDPLNFRLGAGQVIKGCVDTLF